MENSVALSINTDNFMANIGAIFTGSKYVLLELIQNANRAGASKIEFNFDVDSNTLTVRDDGHGIHSLQTLLTICESSWDEHIDEQYPYGLGFMSVLFNCDHVTIRSRNKEISAYTQDIIGRQSLSVTDSQVSSGVELILSGLSEDLAQYITDSIPSKHRCYNSMNIAKGHEIPVYFNGEQLDNRQCKSSLLNNRNYLQFPFKYGVIFADWRDIERYSYDPMMYLQGSAVRFTDNTHGRFDSLIVHLNPDVRARMPDRETLLDSELIKQEFKKLDASITIGCLRHNIDVNGQEWIYKAEKHLQLVHCYLPELVSALPYLNEFTLCHANEFLFSHLYNDMQDFSETQITRDELSNHMIFEEFEIEIEESLVAEQYMSQLPNALLCDMRYVTGTDWEAPMKQCLLPAVTSDLIKIEMINPGRKATFSGYVYVPIQICDEVVLHGPHGSVSITDCPVYDDMICYLPKQAAATSILAMASSYSGEYEDFREGEYERDCDDIDVFVNQLRSNDFADYLQQLIKTSGAQQALIELMGCHHYSLSVSDGELVITQADAN